MSPALTKFCQQGLLLSRRSLLPGRFRSRVVTSDKVSDSGDFSPAGFVAISGRLGSSVAALLELAASGWRDGALGRRSMPTRSSVACTRQTVAARRSALASVYVSLRHGGGPTRGRAEHGLCPSPFPEHCRPEPTCGGVLASGSFRPRLTRRGTQSLLSATSVSTGNPLPEVVG